jgi:hypothetical protein
MNYKSSRRMEYADRVAFFGGILVPVGLALWGSSLDTFRFGVCLVVASVLYTAVGAYMAIRLLYILSFRQRPISPRVYWGLLPMVAWPFFVPICGEELVPFVGRYGPLAHSKYPTRWLEIIAVYEDYEVNRSTSQLATTRGL